MDSCMTLEEVAQYLKVSKDSIYRFAQRGEIPASEIGNLWLVYTQPAPKPCPLGRG